MNEFIAKHQSELSGWLSGFDRLVLRGTLRSLATATGMEKYLALNRILLKDFGEHAERNSECLKQASLAEAKRLQRPIQYLSSSQSSKEEIAREIAQRDSITSGLICVLSCVEPCWTFQIHRDREQKRLQLRRCLRKCLFLYHYWEHPEFGFMHGRIQTWFPFSVHICMNGREWLSRQLQAKSLQYVQHDNCFPWIEDWTRAQQLMDTQLRIGWSQRLQRIGETLNPVRQQILGRWEAAYYWSVYQSEWATDVVFRQSQTLRRLYPRLLHHGMAHLGTQDVMRFLGKRIPLTGAIPKRFHGEVVSDLRTREEGIRLKHSVNGNSVKLYDKAFTAVGSVLRAETTLHNGDDIRVFRRAEGQTSGKKSWRRLRRGVADLYRRAQVSHRATERYLEALASVDEQMTLEELLHRVQQPRRWQQQRVRPLQPFAQDRELLRAIARGEHTLHGFRNRDLRPVFFPVAAHEPKEARRRSALISRKLRLLRAHGLICKITGTHRYQLTDSGRALTTAISATLRATVQQLTAAA